MQFIETVLENAYNNGQNSLTEEQCYRVFNRLGLSTPKWQLFDAEGENLEAIISAFEGEKVVLKISDHRVLHKTEAGGVKIVNKDSARGAFNELKQAFPGAQGILAVEYMPYTPFTLGSEIMLGARADAAFGPLTVMGLGGTGAEFLTKNLREGLAPSIAISAEMETEGFITNSFAALYTQGLVRGGKKHADVKLLSKWAGAISTLITYFSDEAQNTWTIEEVEINPLAAVNGAFFALDGVLRFRKAKSVARALPSKEAVRCLVRPGNMAVAGVSEKGMNMGRIILNNIMRAGMAKELLAVIKPGAREIDGVACYPSAQELPHKFDCLVITVPAASAQGVIDDAAKSGKVNGIILISGGVGEKEGSDGIKESIERTIAQGRALNADFALNGGNSLGIVSNPSKTNTLFIPEDKLTPPLGLEPRLKPCAFLSQSGAFVVSTLSKNPWLKPVYSVTVGNQLDVTVTDYAAAAAEDDDISVILLYIEGFKPLDGLRLTRVIRRATEQGKAVIIYKAGRTSAGHKAVMGHTASIAGDYTVTKKLLTAAGAVMAESFEEFESLARLYSAYPKTGGKIFAISNGGFETSGIADNLADGAALSAPLPKPALKEEMAKILAAHKLDSIVDVRNPFDITPMASDAAYFDIIRAAAKSGQYDKIVYSMVPLSPAVKTLEGEQPDIFPKLYALQQETGVPVIVIVSGGERFDHYKALAEKEGLAVFKQADYAIKVLSKF